MKRSIILLRLAMKAALCPMGWTTVAKQIGLTLSPEFLARANQVVK
jgi:hypothetical protein